MQTKRKRFFDFDNPAFLLFLYTIIISLITYINAYDSWVWLFELIIGWVGVLVLFFTSRKFRFSNLVYVLAGIHVTILAIGAHYTYAEMPLFNWLRDTFDLSRNYYDRIGHFAQGFVPAIIAREIFLRVSRYPKGKMLNFVLVIAMLGLSAFYEFIEWWVVIFFYPTQGGEWLGMQGDIWDAQQDMLQAFIGAILAVLLLTHLHDKSIKKVLAKNNR